MTHWLLVGRQGFYTASVRVKSGATDVLSLHPTAMPAETDWGLVAGLSLLVIETDETSPDYRLSIIEGLALAGAADAYLITASRNPDDYLGLNLDDREAA